MKKSDVSNEQIDLYFLFFTVLMSILYLIDEIYW